MLGDLQSTLPPLQKLMNALKSTVNEEESSSNPYHYKYQHIAEINSESRLLVAPGVKLQLYVNGRKREVGPVKLFVNISDIRKGAKSKEDILQRLFSLMNENENVTKMFGITSRKIHVKRMFTLDGKEILDVDLITNNQELWLSLGDGFIPVECE